MKKGTLKYLLLVTKPYSFSILEPVQEVIRDFSLGEVRWYVAGTARLHEPPGERITTHSEVTNFNPDAVIVPGNVVPHFWPGLKVQIFHGLGEEKKGHYRITGFFDLYCTPGPFMTGKFNELAARKGHFIVRETGWPKLDRLDLSTSVKQKKRALGLDPDRPVILYAPTFSPKYSSANDLLPAIESLLSSPYQWIVKFHDLMDKTTVSRFKALRGKHLMVVDSDDILPAMEASDVLVTDTSSVAYEYLLLDRPLITYQAVSRIDKGINIMRPGELCGAIERSFNDPGEFASNREFYRKQLHPYRDGKSSRRVVGAVENVLRSGEVKRLQPKPRNWYRKKQIHRMFP
ncbi:MAG: CDP-glycerol glycerophosphotransferase family protein [FCB group bacterium]|nr:CDP-glycerol glycerophosphotransferase family protein [FCB group bacterium]